MTPSASSGRAQLKNSSAISTGSGRPSSLLWSRDSPVPRHTTKEERGWQPGCLCLQEAHAHGPVPPLEAHNPTHVKRGVVKCLHDRARGIINTQDNLQKEVDYLARVLTQNMLSWLQCFSISLYAVVVASKYPEKARELWAYQATLIGEARREAGGVAPA